MVDASGQKQYHFTPADHWLNPAGALWPICACMQYLSTDYVLLTTRAAVLLPPSLARWSTHMPQRAAWTTLHAPSNWEQRGWRTAV